MSRHVAGDFEFVGRLANWYQPVVKVPRAPKPVPAPAGQGAIREHVGATLVVALPNRNAVRRDAGTVECRDDFRHGLVG